MDRNRTPNTKIPPSEPAGYKTIQKAFKAYYGKLSTLKDHQHTSKLNKTDTAFNVVKKASNNTDLHSFHLRKSTANSKLKDSETYNTLKKIANRTQVSSAVVSPRKEGPEKRVFRSINSSFGGEDRASYSLDGKTKQVRHRSFVQTKSVTMREKSEGNDKKEEVKQDPTKPGKSPKIAKEETPRPNTRQTRQVEEKKAGVLKSVYKEAEMEEAMSFTDRRKIAVYFRSKIASLTKLIKEKVLGDVTGSSIKSERLSPRRPVFPSHRSSITQRGSERNNKDGNLDEKQIVDMAWNLLKMKVSIRSKFQYQGVTNNSKTIRDLIKSVLPADAAQSPKKPLNVVLSDTKKKPKKPKSPQEDKIAAFQESIHRSSLKVFIVVGGYPRVKKALKERGWIENPDKTSKVFDLKWGSRTDMEFKTLCPHQSVNHFEKSITITSKVSLAWNMRNLIWQGEDIDEYFPRCYDLANIDGLEDFLEDFKFEQAVAVIRSVRQNNNSGLEYCLSLVKLCVAVSFCEKRLKPLEEMVLGIVRKESQMMSLEEWEILNASNIRAILTDSKYDGLVNSIKKQYQIDFGMDGECKSERKEEDSVFKKAEEVLSRLEQIYPQLCMNQGKNTWIVKPAGLSRGRGISCHNSLANILDHIKIRGSEWIIQKYIENPLVIKNKKFDIRQWVLVTNWSPLTVWFYEESYVRFTAQDFNPEDIDNKFAHLTNNAIARKAANFNNSAIEGNMWDSNEFRAYLKETSGKNVFDEMIKPQMKKIVIKSLQCSSDIPEIHKNSFELYGYDFMVDENYRTWLIEINSSPCMEYSTKVTERLVKMVLEDCIKVVVDYGMSDASNKKDIDTGGFKKIFKGKNNEKTVPKYNNFSKFY